MGHIPFAAEESQRDTLGTPWPEAILDRYRLVSQGISAERVAERWEVSRAELDRIALDSHARATEATADGRYDAEIVAVVGPDGEITTDQGIRGDATLEALAALGPAFIDDGKITAGNASQISDGAAALLLADRGSIRRLGLEPRARIVDHVAVGVDPVMMLEGPVAATRRLLERNGLTVDDIDRYEVNEAFASVVAMWQREIPATPDRVNVNGGAIALGHPLGASGARLITSLVHELERTTGVGRGLVAMCCRGGLGTGTLVERASR
jgi:acetyl-CoA acetyltransferase family protein